jgi:fucose 4-O-acetylase-like acetyltransferase
MSSISANAADSPSAAAPAVGRAADNRAQWLDVGRVVAMLTIVHLHTVGGEEGLGYWIANWKTWAGVPVFCAAAALLVFGWPPSSPRRAFWPYVRQRFVRLYVPFLGWATIYTLSRWVASFFIASAHAPHIDGWWLLRARWCTCGSCRT